MTATLNGGTRTSPTAVSVAVSSGTATSGTDFASVSDFTITIPANTLSHTGTFSLDPTQDTIDEPDETVTIDGSTTVSGLAITDTTVSITDDDATPTVTLALDPASISESDAAATTSVLENRTAVTASLNRASSVPTTVTVSVAPDSPAATSDYNISINKVLTIAAGATSSTGAVTVTAADNDVDAADKTVKVKGSAANTQGAAGPADVTLALEDDDTRGVTLSKTALSIDEGGTGTYTVVLDSKPTASVTVTPSRSSGDEDVTVSGALTFTASNWNNAQTVTVRAAQDNDPDDDTAVIGHAVAGGDYASETASDVTVTVDDDETASNTVTLTAAPSSVAEGANATTVTVTATLNGGTRSATTLITVTVGSGTATSGTDFASVSDFTITIPANTLSHTGTFSLDPTQDTIDEPDETVTIDGSTTVSGLAITDTTVSITDDDATPTVTLALDPASISESDAAATTSVLENRTAVTASLNRASSVPTTVTVSVAPDSPAATSDYNISINKVLTIAAGATSSTGAVTVTAADNDVDAADKTVKVRGTAVNTLGVTGPADVTLTLEDDDAPPELPTVTVVATPAVISENGGVSRVTATSTLVWPEPFTVAIAAEAEAPGVAGDFILGGATLSFAAGAVRSTGEVTVTAVDNHADAADKTVTIYCVVSLEGASVPAGVTVTIVDDDEPGVEVSPTKLRVREGDPAGATFTARLSTAPAADVTVTVSRPAAGGLTISPPVLTFTADTWDRPQTATVTAGIDDDAADSTVQLSLSAEGGAYESVAVAPVTVTIVDLIEPARPELRIADARGREADGQLEFELRLSRAVEQVVSVAYATVDGTAQAGLDYTGTAGTVTFADGERNARIVVPLLSDVMSEADESFEMRLSEAQGARLEDGGATGIIEDDGAASSQWLAQLGRIAGDHVMSAVERQVSLTRRARSQLTLAGRSYTADDIGSTERFSEAALGLAQSVGWVSLPPAGNAALSNSFGNLAGNPTGSAMPEAGLRALAGAGYGSPAGEPQTFDGYAGTARAAGDGSGWTGNGADVRRLLANSSFLLNGGAGGGGFTFWGSGHHTGFESSGEGLQSDGDIATATLGLDYSGARGLFGVTAAHSMTDATYLRDGREQGIVEAMLSGLYPYFAALPHNRVSIWGLAGYSRGSMTAISNSGTAPVEADLTSGLAGLGVRGEVLRTDGGFTLALKSDALVTRTKSEEGAGLLAGEGRYRRLRLGLEAAWSAQFESGGSLHATLEAAAREDSGDVENGMGAEVAADIEWLDAAPGLSLSLQARGLVSHESDAYREKGYSASFRYDPSPGSDEGPQVSLIQRWDTTQRMQTASVPGGAAIQPQVGSDAELSWGLDAFGALVVPWTRLGMAGGREAMRFGYRVPSHPWIPNLEMGKSAIGREYLTGWNLNLHCRVQVAVTITRTAPAAHLPGARRDTAFEIRFRANPPGVSRGSGACGATP